MSYLAYPRLAFAGAFQADVSTVNNDPEHFDSSQFQPRFQEFGTGASNGWWNPSGSGAFRLRDCRVTQLLGPQGELWTDAALGGTLESRSDRAPAKLVDLDPEQQMVSMIFGLGLKLRTLDGRVVLAGEFEPAAFSDIWVRYAGGQPDSFFGAVYQSVLRDVQWGPGADSSRFAEALRATSADGSLSIKFNVDGIDDDRTSPTFTWGRVVGAIGPYLDGEPQHFVAGRLLGTAPGSSLNTAPVQVDAANAALVLDLGNSLPTSSPGGSLRSDLGQLQVGVQLDGGQVELLGSVDPGSSISYEHSAGIVAIPLTVDQLTVVASHPLVVRDVAANVLLAEQPDGRFLRPDQFVFRLDPVPGANEASVRVHALRFGQPLADVPVTLAYDESAEQGQVKQGSLPGPPVGTPRSALELPSPVNTGPDGVAVLTLTASDPGNPRVYIDGQVYGVQVGWDGDPAPANGYELSLLVHDAYPVPEQPTWVDDVKPIFQQYANLYPVMKGIVDLSSYHSVVDRWEMIDLAMKLPITDPNHMPVTRDLSAGKRAAIVKWLQSERHPGLSDVDVTTLKRLLQTAIEIEHSTIPVYLSTLFSIRPGRNVEIAEILRSVVVEEMMHMALAANVLNAIGGSPSIDTAEFVPRYPGHLPGDVRPDLEVGLRPLSIEHVRDVLMAIELPANTIAPGSSPPPTVDTSSITLDHLGRAHGSDLQATVDAIVAHAEAVEHHPFSIGWYYQQIILALKRLSHESSGLFSGDPARQITPAIWPKAPGRLYAVKDYEHAVLAIHEIVRQGEGASLNDPLGRTGELAHYFRFSEIVEGRRYTKSSGVWAFDGAPVRFDPAGVFPVIPDPSLAPYSSRAAEDAATQFDATYQGLLASLHSVFNGAPDELGIAVGTMFSLEVQAQQLVQLPTAPGAATTAGPRFAIG